MLAPNVLSEIERRALEIAAEFDRRDGLRHAEIRPGEVAAWYMLRTEPGKEGKASRYLAARGVGVFVPRFDDESLMTITRRTPSGHPFTEKVPVGGKLIFPGRVFAFVWGILDHWRLIRACPGVQSIAVDSAERPVIVPDEQIDRMQVLQFCLTPKGKKRRKRYQCASDGPRTMSTRSFWTVDDNKRTHVLDESLGLAS